MMLKSSHAGRTFSPIPPSVLADFTLEDYQAIRLIDKGLIHQTYKIETAHGLYILQRLNPILATSAIAEDFWAVTHYLQEKHFPAPLAVRTSQGNLLAEDQGQWWRLQTFLPGRSIRTVRTRQQASQAGAIFARFHRAMHDFSYQFQSHLRFNDVPHEYPKFREVFAAHRDTSLFLAVAAETEFLNKRLPQLILPARLPERVIHGDPKISNILFDAAGRAHALVDLDTCNRQQLLIELGNAFRFWCGWHDRGPTNQFRLSMFTAAWSSYVREARDFLTQEEIDYLPQAIQLICLSLTGYFLADYFRDSYYSWDPKRYASRRAHNLDRARSQLALYHDVTAKLPAIDKIIHQTRLSHHQEDHGFTRR
ncbi:phosphotransferase [Candidatus Berkelbacteria bacterium]|nr:phosphotransferase [Candidatus Berkelbacteria bacterium]